MEGNRNSIDTTMSNKMLRTICLFGADIGIGIVFKRFLKEEYNTLVVVVALQEKKLQSVLTVCLCNK